MTVGELKVRLATLDDALLVVLSRDAEGNGFSPLSSTSEHKYLPLSSWSGEIMSRIGKEPTGTAVGAVVLWPVN